MASKIERAKLPHKAPLPCLQRITFYKRTENGKNVACWVLLCWYSREIRGGLGVIVCLVWLPRKRVHLAFQYGEQV